MQGLVRLTAGVVLLLALACTGCAPTPASEATSSRLSPEAVADVDSPPKDLAETLKRVVSEPPISLSVEEAGKGVLVTGWKRHRGEWHIGRYWQERTRYRIVVSPDWDEPLKRSRLRVTAETEQRAAEGQRWDREPRVPRPGRARSLLDQILEHLPDDSTAVVTGIPFGV